MEADYRRLASLAQLLVSRHTWPIRGARVLLLSGLLAMVAGTGYGEGTAEVAQPDGGRTEPIPVIVNLALDAAEGGQVNGGAIATVRAAVMARLEEALHPDEFAAIRTFENLPAIAFSADAQVIALLLAMPEVASIEADREFTFGDTMSSGFK